MAILALQDLIKILERDVVKNESCVEMNFSVDGYEEYFDCFLGKMPDRENRGKESYWFGLVPNCSQAYDYDNLEDFLSAPVFRGKALREIFHKINWHSLNACEVEEMLPFYLD